ncbi:MAG TPA: TonB-dependent receptor [Longimicrobiales bacterium]|nr:TonB-dependent receptor [Longimicrobiales bacterium]
MRRTAPLVVGVAAAAALLASGAAPLSASAPVRLLWRQQQGPGRVVGRVVDARTQFPLPSVQVYVVGTQIGTVTNADGGFALSGVAAGSHELRAERIGYRTVTRAVVVAATGVTNVELTLAEEALALEQVVVTGTGGRARRREVGNSITQINLASVAEPAKSTEDLLQARTPGMTVDFGGATIGQGAAIRLRGNVSMTQSNQPLVYVDGVRQTANNYPRNVSAGGSTFNAAQVEASPLADINPADIERIEVIKGAAAATLYGTEAAAGVIQIFTKRGTAGKTTFNFQTDQGINWIRPYGSDVRPLLNMEPWLKKAYGHKESLSISGGATQIQYFLSGAFEDRDGVLPQDHERRYSTRGNVTLHPSDNFEVDWTGFLSKDNLAMSPDGNGGESIFFNVYRSPVTSLGEATPESIAKLLQRTTTQTDDRVIVGTTARWLPFSWMSHKLTVGYDRAAESGEVFHPYGFIFQKSGDISEVKWESETVTLDYAGNADAKLTSELKATFSLGGQLTRTATSAVDGFGRGLPGPGKQTLSRAAERFVFSNGQEVKTGGFLLQGLFAYKDRYFLTGGMRVDGSSAFGSDFGLQTYPKLSASYVISDESFWPRAFGTAKLRAAYGFAGRAPGVFDAVRTWNAGAFAGQTAFLPSNLGNPKLGPEKSGELEVGVDAAALEDRLRLEFTYYHRHTIDALFAVPQPASNGFLGSQLENVGELSASGIEASIDGTLLRRSWLAWDLGTTVSTTHSKVLGTGGATFYNIVPGQPAPVWRGAKVTNRDEFADPKYEIDAFFGPSLPTVIVAPFTTIRLPRGLLLTARGEYQGGAWGEDFPSRLVAQRGPVGALGCDDVYKIVPWASYKGPGDPNAPAAISQVRALDRARCYKNARPDVWLMPLDFFKLREVTAQVPLPTRLIPRATSAFASISFHNLWRWTNKEFASFDPELIGNRDNVNNLLSDFTDQLPPPATATFSLKLTF